MRKQYLNMKTNESFSRQILLVFFSLLMPLLAHAEPIEVNGIWYNLFDDTEQAEVTFNPYCNPRQNEIGSYAGDITLPSSIYYNYVRYEVTSIGTDAFRKCCNLTSVTLPESVTNIGSCAFEYCSNLTSFYIPESVMSIGDWAFASCESLTSINIPENVTSIEAYTFNNCYSLSSITLPEGITKIGGWAFFNCSSLCNITLPKSLTSVELYAFRNCSSLTSITLPERVTTIEEAVFAGCDRLNSVNLSKSVTRIGDHAFRGCTSLSSIFIPETVTSIGHSAFYLSGITSVRLLENINFVGAYAFSECYNMQEMYCYAENVPETGENCFLETPMSNATLYVPENALDAYWNTAQWCDFGNIMPINNAVSAVIAEGNYYLKNAGSGKFLTGDNDRGTQASLGEYGICVTLNRLSNGKYTINTNVANSESNHYFGSNGYIDAPMAEWIITEVESDTFAFTLNGYNYWGYDGSSTLLTDTITSPTQPNAQWKLVTHDELVNTLGDAALGQGVDATFLIKGHSFSRNHNENAAWMGNPVLGGPDSNFCAEKWNITTVDVYQELTGLPNGYYIVEVQGFYRDNEDPVVTAERRDEGNEQLRACLYAGDNNVALQSILNGGTENQLNGGIETSYGWVPNSMDETASYFAQGYYRNKVGAMVTDGTLRIGIRKDTGEHGDWVIFDNFRLVYYGNEIPIEEIIEFADANVKDICVAHWDTNQDGELSTVEAAMVKSLGNVFTGNPEITSFNELRYFIGLEEIGAYSFHNCSSLTDITLPESVTSIGYWAFYDCNLLADISLPESVMSIGHHAFRGCSCVSFTIPKSVTSIGEAAFAHCNSLNSLVVEEGNTTYDSRNGCNAVIETSSNTLVAACSATVIPEDVTSIGEAAFEGCSSITHITLPERVTSIGDWAFAYCRNLTDITLPKSVTSIGQYAFRECDMLTNVYCHANNMPEINEYAFLNTNIQNATLYVPENLKEDYGATAPWSGFGAIKGLYTLGDVNNDGHIAVNDVVLMINAVLGVPAENFIYEAADMNGDGEIMVNDVVTVINVVLGVQQSAASNVRRTEVHETITMNHTESGLGISLSNAANYTAMQYDIQLSEGVEVSDIRFAGRSNHKVNLRRINKNTVRVLVVSLTNETFSGNELLNVMIDSAQETEINIVNASVSTRHGMISKIQKATAKIGGSATAIHHLKDGMAKADVYDLNGKQLRKGATSTAGLQKGIYIINGKKMTVK